MPKRDRWRVLRAAAFVLMMATGSACKTSLPQPFLPSAEKVVPEVHRRLYLDPPPQALIPELYEFLLVLWDRENEMPTAWGAYVYTSYYVDALRKRPDGVPRLNKHAMNERIDREIEFFYIRVRPTPTP